MKHRAETAETLEEPAVTPGPVQGKHLSDPLTDTGSLPDHLIPATATWKTRRLSRTLLSILTVAASVAVVPAVAYYWQMRTTHRLEVLVVAGLLAVGLWSVLASRGTQQISLRGSLLTVKAAKVTETFDLADGMQPVELTGDPRKGRWQLTLGRSDGTDVVLGRRDVDARQIDPIVRHYREIAQRRRAQRWAMLGL